MPRQRSGPIQRVNLVTKRQTFTDEENQWLIDLHASRPDLGWRALSRRFYRQWGKDRSDTSIITFIKKETQ